MSGPELLDIARDAITVFLQVSMPVMAVGLVVGLAIALIQALTQIQEATLSFVPKTLAIFVALLIFLPFMGQAMNGLMTRIAQHIISG